MACLMEPRIDIIGIGADGPAGLRPELIARIRAAEFLAGGERHLSYFPEIRAERYIIKDNGVDLIGQLAERFAKQRCVVLASGDPLFYGIGTILAGTLGPDCVRIEPFLSSMQLAFARAGLPWQQAALASIHGRDPRATLLPLLGRQLIGLFTQDGESPAAVARLFRRHGLSDYEVTVAENLGAADERISHYANLGELLDRHFASLNYLVLRRRLYPFPPLVTGRNRGLVPGVPDGAFARPEDRREVMTRQEVRAVTLGKLAIPTEPGDTMWDIGAGLGTVAVEMAVLRPHLEIIAVERDPERTVFIRRNQERFDVYNIRVLEGIAPEALVGEPEPPCLVFIGGSGDRLAAILDLVAERLRGGGRLVANFVTLEHLALMLERLRAWGWPCEVTEVHVARSDALAGLTGLKPQRGVFLVSADKPGGNP